jgi:hypothetical protein
MRAPDGFHSKSSPSLYTRLDPEAIYLWLCHPGDTDMAKRAFTIDAGTEKIPVEGHAHQNVAVKYLMKRRRSLIFTKDPAKVEKLFAEVPKRISIIGANVTKTYNVTWERVSTGEFAGARFTFTLEEVK